jgi:hypothetical protein
MKNETKTMRGGKRSNAGRKKLPYEMKQLSIRVPAVHHAELTKMVKEFMLANPVTE